MKAFELFVPPPSYIALLKTSGTLGGALMFLLVDRGCDKPPSEQLSVLRVSDREVPSIAEDHCTVVPLTTRHSLKGVRRPQAAQPFSIGVRGRYKPGKGR